MAVYKSNKPTKDGRQYFFRIKYKDILGNTHDYTSPKYLNLKEAKDQEALYRINIQKQKYNNSTITFKQAFNEWFLKHSKGIKPQTIVHYKDLYKYIIPIENKKINSFNLEQYHLYLKYIEDLDISVSRKNKILGLFKNIVKHSNKFYNTSDNILKYVDNFKKINVEEKEMDFYTYEEYKKFDSVIDSLEWHTLFEILYFLGLRKGELQALTWNDINLEKKELSITKSLTSKIKGETYTISSPKTKNSTRILPLPKILLNDLKTLKKQAQLYKDFSNNWFVFGNTNPFRENTIQNHNLKYSKLANLKHIRVHDFRHSCASFLINKGANITLVSKYLGHSKVSITLDVYSHFYKSELLEIINMIDNI